MKVVRILHPWMPAYRAEFFRKLIQLGARDYIKYEVFAGPPPLDASDRGDNTEPGDFYSYTPTTEIKFFNRSLVLHHLPQNWHKVDLVIAENAIRNLQVYKWILFSKPKSLAFWGHGKTYTKKNTPFEEALKTKVVNRADWFFGYTELGVKSVIEKGFPKHQTTTVQNSTDSESITKSVLEIKADQVQEFKQNFGLDGDYVCVFIGALDKSKRLDFLVESAIKIQQAIPAFQLLVFGDGPERVSLLKSIDNIPFIKYSGRANTHLLALNSKISKLILMPGRVGLISVDSFALGLPIVSTDWGYHAPEYEYLKSGFNSVISNDNSDDFAKAVTSLLLNQQELEILKKNCLISSIDFSIEKMAENFHAGVLSALKFNPDKKNHFKRKKEK